MLSISVPRNYLHVIGFFVSWSSKRQQMKQKKAKVILAMLHLVRCDVSKTFIPQFIPQHLTASWDWEVGSVRNMTGGINWRPGIPGIGDKTLQRVQDSMRKWAHHAAFFRSSQIHVVGNLTLEHWKQSIFLLYIWSYFSECLTQIKETLKQVQAQSLLHIWCIWSKLSGAALEAFEAFST